MYIRDILEAAVSCSSSTEPNPATLAPWQEIRFVSACPGRTLIGRVISAAHATTVSHNIRFPFSAVQRILPQCPCLFCDHQKAIYNIVICRRTIGNRSLPRLDLNVATASFSAAHLLGRCFGRIPTPAVP